MRVSIFRVIVLSVLCGAAVAVYAQSPAADGDMRLFAVEIRTGPKWDAAKPAGEQPFFREHSAHLRRLREAGQLVLGARYGDKGLIVLSAPTVAAARALVDEDPSIVHGTFVADVQEFRVFYPGTVAARSRTQ